MLKTIGFLFEPLIALAISMFRLTFDLSSGG